MTTNQTPQPPYEGARIPDRFRDVPWDDLPPGIQAKIAPQPIPPPAA